MTTKARFSKADIMRLVKAAQESGCQHFKIVSQPDGALELIVSEAATVEQQPTAYDRWKAHDIERQKLK